MLPSTEDDNNEKMGQGRNERPYRIWRTELGNVEEEQRKQEEEISLKLQRLAPAIVHMSKKERDKFQQRVLEALSQENITKELNNIDQRQGHEHIQQLPSAQSPNSSRTSFVISQSTLPHHPTVPPEPDHKYAGGPEKGNLSHRSGQGGQQGQPYQQEQHNQKQKRGQQDLPHQGQHYKQLNQRQNDKWRNQGKKEQLNQRQQYQLDQEQRDQLNQGTQEEQEVERDQQLRQGQYKRGRDTPGQKYQQEKQEQQDLHDQGQQYQQQGQGSQKQKQGQRDQQPKQCQQEKSQHQGQPGLTDPERQGQQDQQLNQGQKDQRLNQRQKDQLNHGQQEQQQQQARQNQQLRQGQQDQQQQQDQKSKRGQEDQNRQQEYMPVSHDAGCKGYSLFGFLILLFLLLPQASAQCSTCLGGRCYDTGQCILGCVPGYMNRYCDKLCPSNCLNNACLVNTTSATITCTDGCKAGYCGTKCTRHCPEGCVTCDRQCGSCNMIHCPERRFGERCRSVCSTKYEKCDWETGQCLRCRRGYFGDNCEKKCQTCYPRGWNLMYKCLSGCEVCKEQDPCPEGLFGEKCELECPFKCGLSQLTAGYPCNRATGECSAGCKPGHHGRTCNYTCDFCVGKICNQNDGVCAFGCVSGYTEKSQACEKLQDTGDEEVTVFQRTLISCLIISSIAIIVLSLVSVVAFSRRSRKSGYGEDDDKSVSQPLRENSDKPGRSLRILEMLESNS